MRLMRTATDIGTAVADSDNDDDMEMQHLVASHDNLKQGSCGAGTKKPEGLFQLLMLSIDERCNVKVLMRLWRPRLEFIVRLMLVATFLEDSFRTATRFSGLTEQIVEQGCLKWFAATSPKLINVIAAIALIIGMFSQLLGSLCVLALKQSDVATKALIGWTIAQPVLFAQLSNYELVAESLSLMGGLLMLRAHLVVDVGYAARTQLLGRLLLPAMSLYYTGIFLLSAFTLDETSSLAIFIASLSMFFITAAVLVGLVISSTLVAAGLKSRLIAFLLAFVNLGFVFYQHPYFRFISLEGGKWKVDEDNMWMPKVALPKDVSAFDFDSWQIYDLHRYYFFLGLSTSGALLLLAQYGPGKIAIQEDEVLVPVVTRALD